MLVHVKALVESLGLECKATIETDAMAALDASKKIAAGRMKHLLIADTFIKKLVKHKEVVVRKIPTEDNTADVLTKHVSSKVLDRLAPMLGYQKLSREFLRKMAMRKINSIKDLQPTATLVGNHYQKLQQQVRAQALNRSELHAEALDPKYEQVEYDALG